jgi:hypothetical protein
VQRTAQKYYTWYNPSKRTRVAEENRETKQSRLEKDRNPKPPEFPNRPDRRWRLRRCRCSRDSGTPRSWMRSSGCSTMYAPPLPAPLNLFVFQCFSRAIALVLEIALLGAFDVLLLHVDLSLSQSDCIAHG